MFFLEIHRWTTPLAPSSLALPLMLVLLPAALLLLVAAALTVVLRAFIAFTTLATAELIKYAANTFLANKITFINEMADLCEEIGAHVGDVARGIGLDGRIGPKFLHPGPGFGGSCFPKDTRALAHVARDLGAPSKIVEAVNAANDARKKRMAAKIIDACGGSVSGITIAILGLTFKPNTDDMREAPSLVTIEGLLEHGGRVVAHDPGAMAEAKRRFGDRIELVKDDYVALEGAGALVIHTEWNPYRRPDFARMKAAMAQPLVFDGRNLYDPQRMAEFGFEYHSVGRASTGEV